MKDKYSKNPYFSSWKILQGSLKGHYRVQYQSHDTLDTARTVTVNGLRSLKILMEKLGPVTPENRQKMARFLDSLYHVDFKTFFEKIQAKARAS